jgi:hypothetical protein
MGTLGGGEAMADLLATNTVLQELDVSDNVTSNAVDDAPKFAAALATGLKANYTLVGLDISRNDLLADGATYISTALKENVSTAGVDHIY